MPPTILTNGFQSNNADLQGLQIGLEAVTRLQDQKIRQQALAAQLQGDQIRMQGQQIENQYNQAKLAEFQGTAGMRQKVMEQQLRKEEAQTNLFETQSKYLPKTMEQQLKRGDLENDSLATANQYQGKILGATLDEKQAQTAVLKGDFENMKFARELKDKEFELSKMATDAQIKHLKLSDEMAALQFPELMQQNQLKTRTMAQELEATTTHNHLLSMQAKGFDLTQKMDAYKAYQGLSPSLRTLAKREMPGIYGDFPDELKEDSIHDLAVLDSAASSLGKLGPEIPGMPTSPIRAQLNEAVSQFLKRAKAPKGKGISIDKLTGETAADTSEEGTAVPLPSSFKNLDYAFSQNKTLAERPFSDLSDEEKAKVAPGASDLGISVKLQGPKNPDGLNAKDYGHFSYALSNTDYQKGATAKQTALFTHLMNEMMSKVAAKKNDDVPGLLESFKSKYGINGLSPGQRKVLGDIAGKYGFNPQS